MPSPSATPVAYDFRRPNKFTREHVRALQIAHETFARQFTTVLSTTLRTVSHVQARGIGQLTYDEYIRDVANPTYLAILSLPPLAGAAIFHLPLPVVLTAVDRLLGGPGTGPSVNRALTEIEQSLVRDLLGRVLRELAYAFESLTALEPTVIHQESNPQFAQIGSPSDMVIVFVYDLRIGSQAGEATLCIPFSALQPVLDEVMGNSLLAGRIEADAGSVRDALAGRMGSAPVTVSVSFPPVALALADIIDLRPGDVLPLDHRIDAPLEVSVGGVPRFAARPGRRGKRLACVITSVAEKETS
ncbi:MAG: flagellar motor switch protein FliM [Actinomycetota bacterium]|jgi:flagellar motor switch protein FliM|nr:flagellar motor switch protein FliM [Actinomycetota bacterium]MDQ1499895.1 flagellar motor switch protein FliM [Actinomycetota bacterium]MDQ1505151.1 flagellar motor switch protein FliM [Actinomycetota bacterium]